MELITGRALFQTHENLEHLAMMEKVLDKIPTDMARRAAADARKYFTGDDSLCWYPNAGRKSIKAVQQLTSLRRLLRLEADSSAASHLDSLHSLLRDMLTYHPHRRRSARDCLSHDFFRESIRSLLPREDDEETDDVRQNGANAAEMQPPQSRSHAVSRASEDGVDACPNQADHADAVPSERDPGDDGPSHRGQNARETCDVATAPAKSSNKITATEVVTAMTTRRRAAAHAYTTTEPESCDHTCSTRAPGTLDGACAVLASEPEATTGAISMGAQVGGLGALVPSVASKENGRSRRECAAVSAKPVLRDFGQKGHVLDDDGLVLVDSEPSKAETVPLNLEEDAHTSDQAENVRWAHMSYAGV